jgi:hypothetical protein
MMTSREIGSLLIIPANFVAFFYRDDDVSKTRKKIVGSLLHFVYSTSTFALPPFRKVVIFIYDVTTVNRMNHPAKIFSHHHHTSKAGVVERVPIVIFTKRQAIKKDRTNIPFQHSSDDKHSSSLSFSLLPLISLPFIIILLSCCDPRKNKY